MRQTVNLIVGVVLIGLVAVLVIALLWREPSGAPVEPTGEEDGPQGASAEVSVFDLEAGACFNGGEGDEVSSVESVECSEAHAYEVFALADFPATADDYPGNSEIDSFAEATCTGDEFESYVGASYETSVYYTTWLTPTRQSWEKLDDREVVCVLYEPEDPNAPAEPARVTGSARDSGQ
jgi:hypothetical protein